METTTTQATFLTPKEFVKATGISARTLRRWKDSNKLVPAVDDGRGKVFYSSEQVETAKALINKNLRSSPSKNLMIPLDKAFKNVFNPTKNADGRNITEDKRLKIKSVVILNGAATSFNQFDKLIYCAAISEYSAGNDTFSLRRLWHKIGGGHRLTDKMKENIFASVEKMACTRVEVNMSDINAKIHYTGEREVIFRNNLLPCKSVEVRVNGKIADGAYKITDKPPLMDVAELKKQFTKQPIELLDVPKLHNSEPVLKIKFYLLERITAIIGSHKKRKAHNTGKKKGGGFIFKRATRLKEKILLDTLFEQCGLSDAPQWQKNDALEVITKTLNHFKAEKFIKDWNFEKSVNQIRSVEIDLTTPSKLVEDFF